MAFKKSKKKEQSMFTASDFKTKALTTGSVDVSLVTGVTDLGKAKNYTATVNTIVTEPSASLTAVLDSVVTSADNTLAIATTLPIAISVSQTQKSVPTETVTITPLTSGILASGTLSLVTSVSSLVASSLSIDVSAGGYIFVDNGAGILSDGGSGSGTVDYNTGAWVITASEGFTSGTVLSADYQVQYYYDAVATPIVITHTVSKNAAASGVTASAVLSAQVTDSNGIASFSSATFSLSTDVTPDDNPWNGKGALPGETALETRGRYIDEGII